MRTWKRPHGRRREPVGRASLGKASAGKVLGMVSAAVATAMVGSACGSASPARPGTSAGAEIPAPSGLPGFYAVPRTLPSRTPGAVIKSAPVADSAVHGQVYRVMYVSTTLQGQPVAVTGLVIVPTTPPPSGGYPVVTWGHGTDGMADKCAPSLQPTTAVPLVNSLLDQGWEVTASDYQGEGTPGLLPYLVGGVAARNTIDIVRAARQLPFAHASNRYAVWGHSEGGQTALFALHIGASYAPELRQVGVVAGAPPSQFNLIYDFLKASPYRYYLIMATAGFNVAYGNTQAPLGQVLTPAGMQILPVLGQSCSNGLKQAIDAKPLSDLLKADPFTLPAWKPLLEANDPEQFTTGTDVPLLMPQGGNDEEIPVASTQLLAAHLCAIHQSVERWIYPGQTHAGVVPVYGPDMIRWIADRFAGGPSPDPMHPTGEPGVQTSTC